MRRIRFDTAAFLIFFFACYGILPILAYFFEATAFVLSVAAVGGITVIEVLRIVSVRNHYRNLRHTEANETREYNKYISQAVICIAAIMLLCAEFGYLINAIRIGYLPGMVLRLCEGYCVIQLPVALATMIAYNSWKKDGDEDE